MPPAKPTTKHQPATKVGLTPLQKYELCQLRAQHPKMKLADFALLEQCPRRPDGKLLAVSSLSDHLKGWAEKVKNGPPSGSCDRIPKI